MCLFIKPMMTSTVNSPFIVDGSVVINVTLKTVKIYSNCALHVFSQFSAI